MPAEVDLFPRAVKFDQLWGKLSQATLMFIAGPGHLSRADWKDRFSDVYVLCTAIPVSFGQRLYRELQLLFVQHVQTLNQQLSSVGEENLLVEYYKIWQTYSAGITYMNQLYWYLNTHVVGRYRSSLTKVNFSHYGIDYNGKMTEIGQLALKTWEQLIVCQQQELLVGLLLKEIDKDRDGFVVNHAVLQGVIQSFVQLRQLKYRSKLQLYEDAFEIAFFKRMSDYFSRESQKIRVTSDCSTFMTKVLRHLSDEDVRARRYLHESSHQRIPIECKLIFLNEDNIAFMTSNCRSLTRKEQWSDLANMYLLLSALEDSKLDVMIEELEKHITEMGLIIVQSLESSNSTENTPSKFIDAMIQFYTSFKDIVTQTFQAKLKLSFENAFDKACVTVFNYKPSPKSTCKFPEMIAKYCDELLRNNAKSFSETEVDDRLNLVILIFAYVEDKDIFERFYARYMAKRLIFQHSQSMEMEESVINRLRQACGYEYTSKLHRMFTDHTISTDLISKFGDFVKADSSRQLHHAFSITVLQAGVWPIQQTSSSRMYLPQELEKSVQLFEQFYNHQFSGRKINWLHNLSQVEVRFGYCKRPYMATVDMQILSILLAFNKNDQMTCSELREGLLLENAELLKLLQPLVSAKILLSKAPLTDASVFQLNMQYNNKRTKFRILPSTSNETSQLEAAQTQSGVEADRRIVMEAALVRIMKARKELRHNVLIDEAIRQTKARFTPKISLIKKCLDSLLEREYIARSENCTDNYIYIA